MAVAQRVELPPLPLAEWEATKTTLHLWAQIVGKVKRASARPKNHWWHVPLYLDVHGLTTRLLHGAEGTPFEIRFDFVAHRLVVETARAEEARIRSDIQSLKRIRRQLVGDFAGTLERYQRLLETEGESSELE